MRWLKRALFTFVAMLLLLAVGVFALTAYESRQVAQFYNSRPILREMDKFETSNDPRRTDVLMKHIPIGSTRDEAFRILSSEGMTCGDARGARKLLVCNVEHSRGDACLNVPRWYIEVQLDKDDLVSGGRVNAGKATCPERSTAS